MNFSDDNIRIFVDLAEKMGTVATEIKEVRREVHNINTSLNEKVALLIEANKLKEKEQDDKINGIEKLVKEIAPLVTNLEPLSEVMNKRNIKWLLVGATGILAVFGFSGGSLTQLAINKVNDTTGVTELSKVVKKNSETLKHLCAYLKAECE